MHTIKVIQIVMVLTINIRPAVQLSFLIVRMTEMDNLMPPLPPKRASCAEECGIMCAEDLTCTSFSYSEILNFCMMSQELLSPYDVSISNYQPGFSHFNVHQEKTKYPAGYRTSTVPKFVIRFHYYWRVDWFQARDVCEQEGAQLARVDTNEKRKFIADAITNDKALNANFIDRFFVGDYATSESRFYWSGNNETLVKTSRWALGKPGGTGNCTVLLKSGSFKMADEKCDTLLPYICELL